MTETPAAIDAYLDELFDRLGSTGAAGRRVLAEAEGHLYESYEANLRAGMGSDAAAEAAIGRFGRPELVGATTRAMITTPPGTVVRQIISASWLIGAVGLACLGISGLFGELLGWLAGYAFLAADRPGVIYTPARCAEFLAYFPGAANCTQAAVTHHFGELVEYREAGGILGILALITWWAVIRRADHRWRPPMVVTAIVGAAAASLVAIASAGSGAMLFVFGARDGFGASFPDAAAAVLGAALFLLVIARLRRPGHSSRTRSP